MDYLDALSGFAARLDFGTLPSEVREQTAWIVADTLASIVGGSAEPELRALAARNPATGAATLPGLGRSAGTDAAALLNGTGGTFLEMDEGNRFSRGHPAVHVLPAALALCEERSADAGRFMAAVVAGYEVGSRLGAASRLRAAMHPHGTWGTIGAAAACARVAALDAAGMRESINIGASMTTATSKQTMLQGALVRNVYAGLSNRNGLLAVQLFESGFSGERDAPGSLFGQIVSDHFDRDGVVRGLGSEWHLLQNYFKLHSCCRFNHATLDAIDRIAQQAELPDPARIRSVQVTTYKLAAELDNPRAHNTLAAKFSVPFAVATRLVHGSSALSSFSWEAVRSLAVRALALKVAVREDPAMSARLPHERPAHVVITLDDGSRLQAEVGVNRGDDALPYSCEELRGKFMDLTHRVWAPDHCARVLEATLALAEPGASFGQWTALLREPPAV